MEEVSYCSIWCSIGSQVATDDVVRLLFSRWNECDRYGLLGHVFFTLLKLEQHRELSHHNTDVDRVSTSGRRRLPITEGIRIAETRPLHKSYFDEVHLLYKSGI